ncbi:hypothetical protein KVR01_010409 [Diaporthe batatas]|uniref:uncharacterized protein n=1 Tax=Diaporthe batatas TaxID=748121 RepID=UPI001D03BD6A|nr:uncharacterized protein KVR01_010409 [Diaporthe batatas]KAG8159772.1 hypothetical protein KVR01_010409 [Diaporthe batatas]
MGCFRITDEMRAHMFDNFSEQTLQAMADFEESTVDEVKERLLEFAASHGLDSLDGPGDKVNRSSQLDGAPMDHKTLDAPQTPTMSPVLQDSDDDDDSIFDDGESVFTRASPATPFTPAALKVTDSSSPVKRGRNECNQLMCQTDGPDDIPDSHDFVQTPCSDGFALDAYNEPLIRLFDPKNSLKHRALDMKSLVSFNPDKQALHLQGVDPSTGRLQADPTTLVLAIDSIVYEGQQAGAAVFFHPMSPWNTVSLVDATEKNAKLEALYIALSMISLAAANDPNLKTVLIKCADRDFCLANTALDHLDGDEARISLEWLNGANMSTFGEIDGLWTDITLGSNGQRAVDVRLWCVPEEDMQTVHDMSLAYMYKQCGRDWWAENGKTPPEYTVQAPDSLIYLQQHEIIAPDHIISQGPQAASRWRAEAAARLDQWIAHKKQATEACRELNKQLRDDTGMLLGVEQFLEAYGLATRYLSGDPQRHIDQFAAEQRAIRLTSKLQGRQMVNFGVVNGEGAEIGGDDWAETLVREVLDMDWEMY